MSEELMEVLFPELYQDISIDVLKKQYLKVKKRIFERS